MTLSIHDILMLSLQFFYAFGGLILIGSLIFNIMKNQALFNEKRLRFEQDFEGELSSQLAEQQPRGSLNIGHTGVTGIMARQREFRRTNSRVSETLSGSVTTGDDIHRKSRPLPVRERVVKQGKTSRYTVAASLAARGFTAKDIRHRVGLPRCEIDLIASLHDRHARGRWEAHQSMLDTIDSGT
jgi:hypothetical protein